MITPTPERTVPITRLRERYRSLPKVVAESKSLCERLLEDVTPLRDEFLEATGAWKAYDLRDEDFYEAESRREAQSRGTAIVTDLLKEGPVSVSAAVPYTFSYLHREVSPRRTPLGHLADGAVASDSGKGGIDYVGIVDGPPCLPVLGEIKFGDDADPFYAFVQLLHYLSELSSEAQTIRAARFLFDGRVAYPTRWDLHILLADFNDRGERGPFIAATRDLVAKFKAAIAPHPEAALLGRVSCLRMDTKSFDRTLALVWEV